MKKILVLNGSYTEISIIKKFKEMGLYVITSGNAPELSGHKYADEYIGHDYSDKEGMLEIAEKEQIDFISSCANDFGVLTAAYIAEKLNLPGHDKFQTAQIIAEKDLFKTFAQEHGLQVIPSHSFDDVEAAIEFARNTEFPIIVKPTDLTGGKGVSKINSAADAEESIRNAFERSRIGHVVIEPFIEGSQHSITTFLIDKKVAVYTGMDEKEAVNYPFLVGATDSAENDNAEVLIEQIEKIAELLNLCDGIFHVQYRMHKGKPLIMECMRRCLGNNFLTAARYSSGIDFDKWIANCFCGLDCKGIQDTEIKHDYISEYYIQAPHNGTVRDIVIAPEAKQFMFDAIWQWEPGMTIYDYQTQKLGFPFFWFPNRQKQIETSSRFDELISVLMETE